MRQQQQVSAAPPISAWEAPRRERSAAGPLPSSAVKAPEKRLEAPQVDFDEELRPFVEKEL